MRKILPFILPSPVPSDMSKPSRMISRTRSASYPSGTSTAVSELECSRGSAHSTSSPQPLTARRVASPWRAWRAKTASSPSSSSSILSASRSPNSRLVAGVYGKNPVGHEQRRVLRLVDRGADLGDAGRDARRGLVVHDAYRLDPVLAIAGELLADLRRVDAMSPIASDKLDIEAELCRHLPPQRREM